MPYDHECPQLLVYLLVIHFLFLKFFYLPGLGSQKTRKGRVTCVVKNINGLELQFLFLF